MVYIPQIVHCKQQHNLLIVIILLTPILCFQTSLLSTFPIAFSGKFFRAENQNENHQVIVCALPIDIKYLLAIFFNYKRNSSDDFEARNWHTLVKEKCTTQNEEEVIYMITK